MIENDTICQGLTTQNSEIELTTKILYYNNDDVQIENKNNSSSASNTKINKLNTVENVLRVGNNENHLNLVSINEEYYFRQKIISERKLMLIKHCVCGIIFFTLFILRYYFSASIIIAISFLFDFFRTFILFPMIITMTLLIFIFIINWLFNKKILKTFKQYDSKKIIVFSLIVFILSLFLILFFDNITFLMKRFSSIIFKKKQTLLTLK